MTPTLEDILRGLEHVNSSALADEHDLREIEAKLHVALCQPEPVDDDTTRRYRLPNPSLDEMDQCAPGTYWYQQRSGRSLHAAPQYLSKYEAAEALYLKVRGEHRGIDVRRRSTSFLAAYDRQWNETRRYEAREWARSQSLSGFGHSAPIALVMALLKVVINHRDNASNHDSAPEAKSQTRESAEKA